MNKHHALITVFVFLIVGFVSANQVFQSQGIEDSVLWIYNYDDGLDTAKVDGTLVLIEFYADWCGRCQDLELETWNNHEIIQYVNTKFTCIKIDVDVNSTLRNEFQVTSLPTVVFLTSSGVEVGRVGYVSSSDFLDFAIQIDTQYG